MFLSTPPSRVATESRSCRFHRYRCFYPRHPRGWRRLLSSIAQIALPVSIHATLAGGDVVRFGGQSDQGVSIHATLAGGDSQYEDILQGDTGFLSTPPSRVATLLNGVVICRSISFYPRHPRGWRLFARFCLCEIFICFYPRHPRGWRHLIWLVIFISNLVSIHATLAGGDGDEFPVYYFAKEFLSTPPSRVATISVCGYFQSSFSFYPRHPRGWRRVAIGVQEQHIIVSIHATLAGGDYVHSNLRINCVGFLSTPPSRVATPVLVAADVAHPVSIHATLAGGDSML